MSELLEPTNMRTSLSSIFAADCPPISCTPAGAGKRRGTGISIGIYLIGDIIDFISQREALLGDYYAAVRDNSRDNDAKLLSYYLSRRYRYFRSSLEEFGLKKLHKLRQRRIREKLDVFPKEWLDLPSMSPNQITGGDLLKIAIRHNKKLIALYRHMLNQPLTKDTRLLIRNLQHQEEKESTNFKKMLAMNYF